MIRINVQNQPIGLSVDSGTLPIRVQDAVKVLPPVSGVCKKAVNFYNYDGTLLYSYTLEEAQALTKLPKPPAPLEEFLEFEEWNWTLEQIQTVGAPVDVGAVYRPVDGHTRAVVNIASSRNTKVMFHVKTWLYGDMSVPAAIVDWGDGEETLLFHETGGGKNWELEHTYRDVGEYIVKFSTDTTLDLGNGTSSTAFVGNGTISTVLKGMYVGDTARLMASCCHNQSGLKFLTLNKRQNKVWGTAFGGCYALKIAIYPSSFIEIPSYVHQNNRSASVISLPFGLTTLGYCALDNMGIQSITLPPRLTSICVGYCTALQEVNIAGEVTILDVDAFTDSPALAEIHLPETLTTIRASAFRRCKSLVEIELPAAVTSVGAAVFYECSGLKRLAFKSPVPPAVANANAFTGIPADCTVEVPAASLAAYQSAANYASIAGRMVGVDY